MSENIVLDDARRAPSGGPGETPPPASRWSSVTHALWRFLPHSWNELLTITIAVVSLAISLSATQSQTSRELRQQLTDTLDRHLAIATQMQQISHDIASAETPLQMTTLQGDLSLLSAQDYALVSHAAGLVRKIPDEAMWTDYVTLAAGFALAGDAYNAEEFYKLGIGAAPNEFAESRARQGYAAFLFTQPTRLDDARAEYRQVIGLLDRVMMDEEVRRSEKIGVYKLWAQSETGLGTAAEVNAAIQEACEIAKASPIPRVRELLTFDLNQFWSAIYQFYGFARSPQCQ